MEPSSNFFKTCPMCGKTWKTRDEFLKDRHLELLGYQANVEDLEHGLFLFTHNKVECGTTLSVAVKLLLDLNPGQRYPRLKFGTKECSGFCLKYANLEECEAECEGAFVRDLIKIVKEYGSK